MKPIYLLYGLIIGLLPFAVGLAAAEVAPHSGAAQLPWLTMVSLPLGVIGGLVAMFAL